MDVIEKCVDIKVIDFDWAGKCARSHLCVVFSAPSICLLSHPFIDLNIGQGDSQEGSSSFLLVYLSSICCCSLTTIIVL